MSHLHEWHDSFIRATHTWLIHMCVTHTWLIHMRKAAKTMANSAAATLLIRMCGMTHPRVWHDVFICVAWRIEYVESCYIYEWAMSHIWMSRVTHMNESCHIYEWAKSHIWMSHATYVNEPCRTYEWVMPHIWMSHPHVWHDSSICVTWRIHMCDMTHSYVWHDSFICVTWLIHRWEAAKTRPPCSHCLVCMRYVTRMNASCHTYGWGMSHVWMSHVTYGNVTWHTYEWVTWLPRNSAEPSCGNANKTVLEFSTWKYLSSLPLLHIDRKKPPPGGGFLFTMFPHQEPCVRGPPSKNLAQILRGGSSYTRFLMREHSKEEIPPGGGVSLDQYHMPNSTAVMLLIHMGDMSISHVQHDSFMCSMSLHCLFCIWDGYD